MKKDNIEIITASELGYEKLTAEIYINDKFVASLNQEAGLDNLVIEFPAADAYEDAVQRNVDLADFEKGLELAKRRIRNEEDIS